MSNHTSIGTGWLVRDGDGIKGTLTDLLGVETVIIGVPAIRDGVRGYVIEARVATMPAHLRMPWDEEAPS
jgi:hypothetical protein